jgi:hypothetical protein
MGASFIGSLPLENGETVWVVYLFVDMPDSLSLGKGTFRFFKGKNEKDLSGDDLGGLALAIEPDGSPVIYDCAVQISR